MLRALNILNSNAVTSALPAVQQVLGVAQQCCYATKKQASYVEDATKAKAKKEISTKVASKRAPTAYNLFIKERSASITSGTAADRVRRLAQEWKTLPAADKAPYESEAAALKEEHAQVRLVLTSSRSLMSQGRSNSTQRPAAKLSNCLG
jgi:hypothetical protein